MILKQQSPACIWTYLYSCLHLTGQVFWVWSVLPFTLFLQSRGLFLTSCSRIRTVPGGGLPLCLSSSPTVSQRWSVHLELSLSFLDT